MPEMIADADPAAAGLDPAALGRVGEAVRRDIDAGRHYGASVLVARGGVVGFHAAIGTADAERARPSRVDDRYVLMSTTKSMTAAAVLQLVDRGLLRLDTRIAEIIPEFAFRGKQRITVRHLLTHTGGFYQGFSGPAGLTFEIQGDLHRAAELLAPLPALHRPGLRVIYSPWESFAILGECVHRLDPAHRSLRDYLREEIFDVLGMPDTSLGAPVDDPRRVPVKIPHAGGAAQAASVIESLNRADESYEFAAGGVLSTTSDVFRFADALRRGGGDDHGRILSRALTEYAAQNHTGDLQNEFWDFNKEAADLPDFPANFSLLGGYVRGAGHFFTPLGITASPRAFGAAGSGSTGWMVDPERDLTVVFLSSGLVEGLAHFERLQRIYDLALASAL